MAMQRSSGSYSYRGRMYHPIRYWWVFYGGMIVVIIVAVRWWMVREREVAERQREKGE